MTGSPTTGPVVRLPRLDLSVLDPQNPLGPPAPSPGSEPRARVPRVIGAAPGTTDDPINALRGLDLAAANAAVVERGAAGLAAVGVTPEHRVPIAGEGAGVTVRGSFDPRFRNPAVRATGQARIETGAGRLTVETGAEAGRGGFRGAGGAVTLAGEGREVSARIETDRRMRMRSAQLRGQAQVAPGLTINGRVDFGQAGRVTGVAGAAYRVDDLRFSAEARRDLRTGATTVQGAVERELAPGWSASLRAEHDLRTGRTAVGARLTGRF